MRGYKNIHFVFNINIYSACIHAQRYQQEHPQSQHIHRPPCPPTHWLCLGHRTRSPRRRTARATRKPRRTAPPSRRISTAKPALGTMPSSPSHSRHGYSNSLPICYHRSRGYHRARGSITISTGSTTTPLIYRGTGIEPNWACFAITVRRGSHRRSHSCGETRRSSGRDEIACRTRTRDGAGS